MRMCAALGFVIALALIATPATAQRLPFQKAIDATGVSTLDVSTI
jgi:hypothetical protein